MQIFNYIYTDKYICVYYAYVENIYHGLLAASNFHDLIASARSKQELVSKR